MNLLTRRIEIILVIFAIPLFAGQSVGQGLISELKIAELERTMAANLTWNLQSALLTYYPESKFVIKARVRLKKVVPQKELPQLPEALLKKDITNLPGLPYLPDNETEIEKNDLRQPPTSRLSLSNDYDVQQIRVEVLVDESLTENDWSFIRRFISMHSDLEAGRGDQVRIERMTFPVRANYLDKPPRPIEPKPEIPPQQNPAEEKSAGFDWRPYGFAGILFLLLLGLFLLGFRFISKKSRAVSKESTTAPSEPSPSIPVEPKTPEHDKVKVENITELMRWKSAALEAMVGTPATSANVLNQWIEEREEQGCREAAILLSSISNSLIELLAPHLGKESTNNIRQKMTELQKRDLEESAGRLLKQFEEDLRRHYLTASEKESAGDVLSFLNQLSDNQLLHLIKPLKYGVMAIVLAHVRSNRAAKILSTMEPEQKKAVLAAMANIERIPMDVYQHIARRLSARAGELKKMRYVTANGVDAMVKVLEHLDEKTQDETLSYLQTQDVRLAEKVNQRFMTFNQLLHVPNEKIRELALNLDRETLAKSLVSVDEKAVEKIINALPEKLGEMVRASLEQHHDLPESEITQARRALMRSVRSQQS